MRSKTNLVQSLFLVYFLNISGGFYTSIKIIIYFFSVKDKYFAYNLVNKTNLVQSLFLVYILNIWGGGLYKH
jgi:hypothetical protein